MVIHALPGAGHVAHTAGPAQAQEWVLLTRDRHGRDRVTAHARTVCQGSSPQRRLAHGSITGWIARQIPPAR